MRARFVAAGGAGLAHGNRGRAPANRVAPALARRIIALAGQRYADINDSHLAELLAEREGIRLSRKSVQRILRAAGVPSPRRH
ncbi:MAG: helix-turn-helix domain-containing protein, partial [Candidatus Limnocylindria bacterium]